MDMYDTGWGVTLCNLRLLDNEIRFSLAKDEEQAQMHTEVGSTTTEITANVNPKTTISVVNRA